MPLFRRTIAVVVVAGLLGFAQEAAAQLDHLPYMLKFNRGQNVQPVFQGWSRNPDGTFDMHFGYLNRNYQEELHIPVGPDNYLAPGGPDHGQPTFFYTRTNRQLFAVTIPADFGNQELVWELTAYGKTERAVGWLQADWEIYPPGTSSRQNEEARRNQPPAVTVAAPSVTGRSVELTATVTDDDLPEPRPELTPEQRRQRQAATAAARPAGTQARPPILTAPDGAPQIPTNLPDLGVSSRGSQTRPRPPTNRLSVSYLIWRGPAGATFEPAFAEVADGASVTTATFSLPGEYQLQVRAHDGAKSTYDYVTVTVQ